ncbi:MAG: general secretion pathway protein GspK [Bryobacteraceae bacterium]|nr:general secretion pathway protein GspK [Bryobacteraceae bacterium]
MAAKSDRHQNSKGGALLAVLWISAALAAIAFSVAQTVRTETERTSTFLDGVRTYYLATGAIQRVWLYAKWGESYKNPDGSVKYFKPGTPQVVLQFPAGTATVDIIPENSKLSVNAAKPEELLALMVNLRIDPDRARQIVSAILDWRSEAPGNQSVFDQFYNSITPSFRARHASLLEIEELLLVKGMTPDLFYGTLVQDEQGRLVPQYGLRDCLSVYGSEGRMDVNSALPAVMAAIGIAPEAIVAIVQRRRSNPFREQADLIPFQQFAGPSAQRLVIGGNTIFTFRSTAQLRLPDGRYSDMKRTVSAMLKFHRRAGNASVEVLRWYDY